MTFSLLNPPAGVDIDSEIGLFSWRPALAKSPSSNAISVVVTDDGFPNLSDTQTFWIAVNQAAQLSTTLAYEFSAAGNVAGGRGE